MRTSIVRRAALLALLLASSTAAAAPPSSYTDAWRWTQFTTASGLPSNLVHDALEVNGTLWAETRDGVAWFDGYSWHKPPGSPDRFAEPTGLAGDPLGNIAVIAGGQLLVGSPRGFRAVVAPTGSRFPEFKRCARAATGSVLIEAADREIYEWDGSACRRHEPSRAIGRLQTLIPARPASVWASTDRGLWRWDGRAWRHQLDSGGATLDLNSAAEQADGTALVFVRDPVRWRGLWQWKGTMGPRALPGRFTAPVVSIALSRDGETVLAHNSGEVVHRSAGGWDSVSSPGRALLEARSVGFLANQDLWVASDHGVFVYRSSSDRWRIQIIPQPDDRNTINDLAAGPDGSILIATGQGLLADSGGSRPDEGRFRDTEAMGTITGIAFDARGRLWAASGYSFAGLRRREADGRWQRPVLDPGLDSCFVHRIAKDRTGGLWFLALARDSSGDTAIGGAYRLLAGDRVQRWGPGEGLLDGRVYAFAEGPDGAYWFGTSKGLSRWRQGQWRHWTPADGLRRTRVFAIAVDAKGVVWFAQQGDGLGRVQDDAIGYLTVADGLATDSLWSVQLDDRGRLWAAGDGGISVLDHDTWTSFDARSGLASTRIWPILFAHDRVYLGSRGGGLMVLNPGDRAAPPPIVVHDPPVADEGGFSIRWRAFAWWGDVAPDAVPTRLRVDSGAWTPWSTDREWRGAGLAPGRHEVRFESKDVLGTVNAATPVVSVVVPPPLFARPQFYLPIAALTLVAVGLVAVLAFRQRRHHLELHEREEQFIRTFQSSPVAASITSVDEGRFLDVNEAFARLSGFTRAELVGRRAAEMNIGAENYDRADTAKAMRAGGTLRGLELKARRRSGERLEVVAHFQAIEFDGHEAILGQFIDVTEQRRLEGQLRQAQKMESIGRLAGGVAHDFNNLLTVIIGNASLIDSRLAPGDPRREEVEQITIASDRAERLTRQLLAFARRQVVEPKLVYMNDLVFGTDRVLRRLIGEDVELVTIPGADLPPVFADPNQLEQVLWNMAVNARDAMPGGGTLTIRTSAGVLGEGDWQDREEAAPGRYVRLSITDTGHGMDTTVRSRLFEPFFTTKEPGKGTGLGLATCYGIVQQAGGHILVESEPGRGTTFHVDLPPAPESVVADEPRERPMEMPGGAETILLVEDEVQLRKLAASVLRQRGYQVLEAENGQEALQVSGQYHGRIDLLITDVVMPLMRGTVLAQRMHVLRPGLQVLFVSGYADNEAFTREAGTDRVEFLPKPFTPAALARRVRDLLDQAERT